MAAKLQGVDASSGEAQKSAAAPASKPPHERNFVVILLLIVTPLARAVKVIPPCPATLICARKRSRTSQPTSAAGAPRSAWCCWHATSSATRKIDASILMLGFQEALGFAMA